MKKLFASLGIKISCLIEKLNKHKNNIAHELYVEARQQNIEEIENLNEHKNDMALELDGDDDEGRQQFFEEMAFDYALCATDDYEGKMDEKYWEIHKKEMEYYLSVCFSDNNCPKIEKWERRRAEFSYD